VPALTLYAFSSQNWARPSEEVAGLMELLREFLLSERSEILDNGIRLNAIGEVDKLPRYVREPLERVRADSAHNQGMVLTLALSYGGREEIAAVARALAEEAAAGKLDPATINASLVAARLPSLSVGDPDLIIRTGGEQRISNFLLYGAAYAELAFTDRLWPDFIEDDLFAAISSYQRRERRFGNVGKPLAPTPAPVPTLTPVPTPGGPGMLTPGSRSEAPLSGTRI
jgi:undecaprenyl diphosphate synthase